MLTSFETNVLPAPVNSPALAWELDALAPLVAANAATTAAASTASGINSLLINLPPLVVVVFTPRMPSRDTQVGFRKVTFR